MAKFPTLSPLDAIDALVKSGEMSIFVRGFEYNWDGDFGGDPSELVPCATRESDGSVFFPAGMPGDEITTATTWVE